MDILKNPIVLGLTAGVITYVYLLWTQKEKKNKAGKKVKQDVNIMIPAIVAVVVWFIVYGYTEFGGETEVTTTTVPNPDLRYKLVNNNSTSDSVASFKLINKGVNIPNNLPDVFIETY